MTLKAKILFTVFLFLTIDFLAQNKIPVDIKLQTHKKLFGLESKLPENFPKISLVLSGGGARGFAQIGILKALQQIEIPINSIVGTSMGSIVGGLYSSGYTVNEIDSLLSNIDWNSFLSVNDANRNELFLDNKITEDRAIFSIRLDNFNPVLPTAISSGQRVLNFLNSLTLNAPIQPQNNFSELLYDFYAVSTNLVNGEAVILHHGSLSKSIRASSSVSFFLAPVKFDSLLLADGGLVANVPINIAKNLGADYIIGINTTSALRNESDLKSPLIIADQVVSIPISILTKENLKNADYLITPNLRGRKNSDFSEPEKLVKMGYDIAIPQLNLLQRKIDSLIISKTFNDSIFLKNFYSSESDNQFEKELNEKYSKVDSVNLGAIKYDIFKIIKDEEFENYKIFIEQTSDNLNHIKFDYKLNPITNEINIHSSSDLIKKIFEDKLSSLLGKPFSSVKYQQNILKSLRSIRKKGYSLCNIDTVIFNKLNGQADIYLSDGILDSIIIEGNSTTRDEVILRELELQEGKILNILELVEGLDNLRATNLFDEVDVVIKKHADKSILVINVIEKIPLVIRFGLKVDNEYFSQISVDIRNENLGGSGTELGANFLIGPRNRFISLEHKTNRIFDTYFTYKLKGFFISEDISIYSNKVFNLNNFSRVKVGEYRQSSLGVSLGLGMQIKKAGNFIVEAKYQHDNIDSIFNSSNLISSNPLSILKFSFNIDTQDRFPFPRKGIFLNTYYETAQTVLGSTIGYTKLFLDYKSYFTIKKSSTLRFSSLVGVADKTLPLTQQFSLGGQNNFFGYNLYDYRGRQILITSIEYQYFLPVQLFFDTYIKARYDLGGIWENREDIKFKDLRHGIGLSIAFDTPIGPADFSLGKSFLLKKELLESKIVWGDTYFYFTIGYYF